MDPPITAAEQSSSTSSPTVKPHNKSHEGEHRGDHGETGHVVITNSCKLYVFCAALNSCNLGYDIGVNTSAGPLLQNSMNLSDTQLELWYGSLNIWAMIGSIFASYISDTYGRRKSFIFAAIGFIIGVIIMISSSNYTILMIGRIFVGLGIGFGLAIDPLYISEISPASHRGQLVTWSENAINIGIILGFISGLLFSSINDNISWRLQIGLGCILPIIMIFLAWKVMPESPRWLISKERNNEARQVLSKLYPINYDITPLIIDIKDSIQREIIAEQSIGWGEILSGSKAIRRMLLVGIGCAIFQQAVGIDAIQYYLVFILEDAGIDTRIKQSFVLIGLGIIKLAFVLVATKLFDRIGRRPLFFISTLGMMISLIFLGISFLPGEAEEYRYGIVVVLMGCYFAFFSIGIGPGAWLIPSEIFATCIRAKAMSIATFANRATATIMSSTFFTIEGLLTTPGYFFVLGIICIIGFIFFMLLLPETKGRSLEDMTIYFAEITNDTTILNAEEKILKGRQSAAVALGLDVGSGDIINSDPGICNVELVESKIGNVNDINEEGNGNNNNITNDLGEQNDLPEVS